MTFPRLALAVAAVVLAAPATANAGQVNVLEETRHIADQFWQARGVLPCPTARETFTVESGPLLLDSVEVDAWAAPCEPIVINRGFLEENVRDLYGLRLTCSLVVHEVGHARGLEHSTGVMAADIPVVPFPCKRWARRAAKRMGAS